MRASEGWMREDGYYERAESKPSVERTRAAAK